MTNNTSNMGVVPRSVLCDEGPLKGHLSRALRRAVKVAQRGRNDPAGFGVKGSVV
jgi:hypothetical protein